MVSKFVRNNPAPSRPISLLVVKYQFSLSYANGKTICFFAVLLQPKRLDYFIPCRVCHTLYTVGSGQWPDVYRQALDVVSNKRFPGRRPRPYVYLAIVHDPTPALFYRDVCQLDRGKKMCIRDRPTAAGNRGDSSGRWMGSILGFAGGQGGFSRLAIACASTRFKAVSGLMSGLIRAASLFLSSFLDAFISRWAAAMSSIDAPYRSPVLLLSLIHICCCACRWI